MNYDPTNREHRNALAVEIIAMLETAGFQQQESTKGSELVFSRTLVEGNLKVMVYTSVIKTNNLEVREVGTDAIRVAGVYITKKGDNRGIVKNARIYRTGKISEIPQRVLQRMRATWKALAHAETCEKCGAPLFTSKKGNLVCTEVCFAK